jgi:uncharacterized protein
MPGRERSNKHIGQAGTMNILESTVRLLGRAAVIGMIVVIRAYQMILAPHLVGGCRHIPSCSSYAITALDRHGVRHGLRLTAGRLWRCRPKGTFGYDPVP